MTEKRKHVRNNVDCDSIVVFDLKVAKQLGRLENISMGGFLLDSDLPVMMDKIYQISISLPTLINGRSVIRCCAESLWGDEARIPNHYWTGFQFVDISETDTKAIEHLMKRVSDPCT